MENGTLVEFLRANQEADRTLLVRLPTILFQVDHPDRIRHTGTRHLSWLGILTLHGSASYTW